MNNKYEIMKSGENKGRIRALRSFGNVKKDDNCWVYDMSKNTKKKDEK